MELGLNAVLYRAWPSLASDMTIAAVGASQIDLRSLAILAHFNTSKNAKTARHRVGHCDEEIHWRKPLPAAH